MDVEHWTSSSWEAPNGTNKHQFQKPSQERAKGEQHHCKAKISKNCVRLREPLQTYSCSLLTPCHSPGPPPFLLKQPLWGAANHHKLAWHSISVTHASSSNIRIGNHEVIAAGYHHDEYWSKKRIGQNSVCGIVELLEFNIESCGYRQAPKWY